MDWTLFEIVFIGGGSAIFMVTSALWVRGIRRELRIVEGLQELVDAGIMDDSVLDGCSLTVLVWQLLSSVTSKSLHKMKMKAKSWHQYWNNGDLSIKEVVGIVIGVWLLPNILYATSCYIWREYL